MQGVQFSIGLDNSRLISGNKQVQNAVNDTGKLIESIFGQKLKQVISIVTIEEATRRTAEWAQQIEQTSKNLGITAEQLQTLNHIASATGTADSAVSGLFENIQKSAQEALSGNNDVIQSFKKMGITIADIKSHTQGQLFSKVMSGLPGDIRTSHDQMLRTAYNTVTGTPENTLQTIKAGYNATPGNDLAAKGENLKEQGAISSNENVQQLSQIWSEVVTSLKEAGTKLLPIASMLLSIVKTLIDAFGGIENMVGGLIDIVIGSYGNGAVFKTGIKKFFGTLLNSIFGIFNVVYSVFDQVFGMIARLPFGNKIAKSFQDLRKDSTIGWEQFKKDANSSLGLDDDITKKGQAVGETATMIAPGGEGLLKAAGSTALKVGAKGASTIGLEGLGTKLATKAEVIDEGMTAKRAAQKEKIREDMHRAQTDAMNIATGGGRESLRQDVYEESLRSSGYDPKDFDVSHKELGNNIAEEARKEAGIAKIGIGAGIADVAGSTGMQNINALNSNPNNVGGVDVRPTIPRMSWDNLAGGSANLKMGGMFGTGYNTIIKLNQKMVEHLATIAHNTSNDDTAVKPTLVKSIGDSNWNGLSGPAGGF